jgi:hypothetical protein
MSLVNQLQDFATRVATEMKAHKTLINGNAVDLSSLTTTAKSNLVAAINEVDANADAATQASLALIDDTRDSSTTTNSSTRISSKIYTAVAGLVNGSPAALDTLKEFSDALGGDANFAASTATAIGNRLRVDAPQSLNTSQQTQGQANLNVYSTTQIGDPTTDFLGTFVAGLS